MAPLSTKVSSSLPALRPAAVAAAAVTLAVAQAAAPPPERLEVEGVDLSGCNGLYYRESAAPFCYEKTEGEKYFLCKNSMGFWALQGEKNKMSKSGYVISQKRYITNPNDAGPWLSYDLDSHKWEPQEGLTVSDPEKDDSEGGGGGAGEPGGAGAGGSVCSECRKSQRAANWHAAGIVLGVVLIALALMPLVRHKDSMFRAYMYKTISSTLVVFMAAILVSSLWDLVFNVLIVGEQPGGLGLVRGSSIACLLGLTLFFAALLWLSYIGWKVQFDSRKLAVLKRLVSCCVAFVGIFAFLEVQHAVLRLRPGDFGLDADVDTKEFEVAAVASVVFVAWILMVCARAAARGVRGSLFGTPPRTPWASKKPKSAPTPENDRSCGFTLMPCAGAPPAAAPPEDNQDAWKQAVVEGEQSVLVLIVSFLLDQVFIMYCVGELPGMHIFYVGNGRRSISTWCLYVACLLLALAILLFLGRLASGRVMSLLVELELILTLSIGWALFRVMHWQMSHVCGDDRTDVLVEAFSALLISSSVVLLLLTADLLRSVKVPIRGTSLVWLARLFFAGVGLLLGASWDRTFEIAIQESAKHLPEASQYPLLITAILSILVFFAVAAAWRDRILPKAEMSLKALQDQIREEARVDAVAEDELARSPKASHAGFAPP